MGVCLGTLGTANKNQSWAPLQEQICQADRQHISFKVYRLWASLDSVPNSLLATAANQKGSNSAVG